jgi:hypothetical protein
MKGPDLIAGRSSDVWSLSTSGSGNRQRHGNVERSQSGHLRSTTPVENYRARRRAVTVCAAGFGTPHAADGCCAVAVLPSTAPREIHELSKI